MIKVGFIVLTSDKWTGGANYFKNLLYAISKLKPKNIQPVLFFATNENRKVIESFEPLGEIVKTDILDKDSFSGLLNVILMRVFNKSFLLKGLFKKNQVDVVSHTRYLSGDKNIKTINWITDFQHIYFPEMFSLLERTYRNILFSRYAKKSDAVILGSFDSLKTYKELFPRYANKAKILHFVSQPNKEIYNIKDAKKIEKKYHFSSKFFFLPNQFWKHKNHMVVLKAINLLKKQRNEILVICTGYMKDYRNSSYTETLTQYVKKNKLENNIKFLGLIDHEDVMTLMRHCVSIINPSLFEGWSTTVEEAKSIGKNMILSNLNVHREQNPPNSVYLNPHDEKELAEKLCKKWKENGDGPDFKLESLSRKDLVKRTEVFGEKFQDIVLNILEK